MSVITANDRVSNRDEGTEELEEAAQFAGDGQQLEVGENGLEALAETVTATLGGPERAAAADNAPSTVGLLGAAEATYGSPATFAMPESVIGDDGRRRIENTDDYPWRVHASLRITARDGSIWIGTAFFIAPRVLATAGHNLYLHGPVAARRGWVNSIQVMPGRNEADLPFGSVVSSNFHSVRGWTEPEGGNPDPDYDYGVIILDEDDDLGNQTGWIGFGTYSDATLRSTTGNLSGYPKDLGNGAQQWYMARRIDSVSSRRIFYDIDTFGGQSGSAVYRIKDGSRFAIGIHAYGVGSRPLNSATRIGRPVFDNLKAWKNDNQ